jgi:hypothetical protein
MAGGKKRRSSARLSGVGKAPAGAKPVPTNPVATDRANVAPSETRSQVRVIALAASTAIALAAGVAWWLRGDEAERTGVATPAPAPPANPGVRDAPAIPVDTAASSAPNPYVGSSRCKDCHEKEHAAWQKSWHAKALAPGDRKSIVGNFANAHFVGTSSEAWMTKRGDRYVMRARGATGELADFSVDWVIGGKRMQDNVTVFPDGRWQVLPVYFHTTGKQWVDYTETKQGALTPEHPFYWTNSRRMANHECLDCHTTALRVSFDETGQQWHTTFVDPNVACEDCHGAGGRHSESQETADIVHPVDSGAVGMSACARCHGPRKPLFPMLDPEHQFQLGQSYDELYDPIVVVLGDGVSPEFFVDGKPKTSSFEYQGMLQAACFRRGGATCLTCHSAPHDAKGHAELRAPDPDASCVKCHPAVAAAGKAHTHHDAVAARSCIACHMAPIVSGVLDHFADHSIDVPVPQNTDRHGVPNACGVCHDKKAPGELAKALASWWPDAGKRAARRIRLADAFDPKTAKDSARALVGVIHDDTEAPTLRGAAMIVAARRFGPPTARALQPFLASPNLVLRAKAIEALSAAKATASADAIAARLADPSLRIRLAAAVTLHDLRDPRGESALRKLADAPESSHLLLPHAELGPLFARRGDFDAARKELTAVARLAPYFIDPLVQLAAIAASQGDLVEARARIAQVLALEPQHRAARALRDRLDHGAAER